jgi:hypothetical protein
LLYPYPENMSIAFSWEKILKKKLEVEYPEV